MKQLLLAVVMLGGIAWGQESSPTPPPKGYIRVWSSGDLTCLTYEDARVSCGRGSIEGFIPLTVKRPHCWTKEGTALGVECSKHVWQKADAPERRTMTIPYLAPREKELARLLIQGKNDAEISKAMGISENYAQVARSRLIAKLKMPATTFIAEVWKERVRRGSHFLVDDAIFLDNNQ
jgi:DNA-binding CsgD family transcriptional regulator